MSRSFSLLGRPLRGDRVSGARILNLSLRGTVPSSVLADAVAYAQSKGALIIAAAGNDGQNTPVYPAAHPGVLGWRRGR